VRGATAYVTLEPCNHHGRTPPCSDALVRAGLGRVVAAMEDPESAGAGQGMAKLAANGIATQVGLLAEQAYELNIGFFSRMTRGLPWVRMKTAASLDGMTACTMASASGSPAGGARRRPSLARPRLRHPDRHRHRQGRRSAAERARGGNAAPAAPHRGRQQA
jgi:hypothetical protein